MASTVARQRPRGALVLGLVAVIAAIGMAFGVWLAREGDDQSAATDPTTQVAAVQQACQQWLAEDDTFAGSERWCSDLTGWMSQHMNRDGMGPRTMWSDSQQLRSTCQQWMTDSPPNGAPNGDAQQWCDRMIDWMSEHMSDWSGHEAWDDWMRAGPMMRS